VDGRVKPGHDAKEKLTPLFSSEMPKNIMKHPIALIALDRNGLAEAKKLLPHLPNARLHGLSGRTEGTEIVFADTIRHLQSQFAAGNAIVAFCAAGIVIRSLAPLLSDKRLEPPVLAVSPDGHAVPLLGGHHGANRLARQVAEILGGVAAVTTSGDSRLGFALDEPPQGWKVANPESAKAIAAALLAGEKVRLEGKADWLDSSLFANDGQLTIRITEKADKGDEKRLVIHPPLLALGVGCERGTEAEELADLVMATLAEAGLSPLAIAGIYSLDLKANEAALHALAAKLDVPARFFSAARLEKEAPRLANPSETVFKETGCHGVSEGAALAAAGPSSTLIVSKKKSKRATCAIALSPLPLTGDAPGQKRGRLYVVGTGPGHVKWRTPELLGAIADSEDVVGYKLYLDLIEDLLPGKNRHDGKMGQEELRAREALDLAAQGKTVSLVCSGDPGIYALATLVYELIDKVNDPTWNRLDVQVCPGISAAQATAAKIGAPLNHDFCFISLSDLLTPWESIEVRLHAAAKGDFVVALYNPVSKKRRDQIVRARDILLAHRPPTTPVIIARNVGRPDEEIRVITLTELSPDQADMLTTVIIGSSETRLLDRPGLKRVYTPRGYAKKMRL
jgi:cobalt-precorrin 5A hydrolase/precorrin-3B C17-methyltransferase